MHDYHSNRSGHMFQEMQPNVFRPSKQLHVESHSRGPPRVAHYRTGSSRSSGHGDETTSYKGIRYRPELNRYISEIRPALPRKRKIWLGTYKTAFEAALAFDAGVYYTGKKIGYNFPEYVKNLPPLDENLDQDERHIAIQKRAKLAASIPHRDEGMQPSKTREALPSPGSAGRSSSNQLQYPDNFCSSKQLNDSHRPFYEFFPPVSREPSLAHRGN